jgi:glycerophosphoryl diester phosphodiesterase
MAILQGSSGVEFDIYATKDLIPVVIHDASIRRTTNETENIYVSDLTYEKLQEYDAGSWFSTDFIGELVPSFEETLQTIKGRTTGYIDIKTKNQAVEIEVLRLIEEYDMINEVKVMSFDANQLFRFKEMNSEIETVLLVGVYDLNIYNYILDERIDHVAIQIQVIKNNPDLVFVTHNQGKKVYAWGVDDRNAINIGVNADVDGFITKRPILTREIAYSKNTSDYLRRYIELLFN